MPRFPESADAPAVLSAASNHPASRLTGAISIRSAVRRRAARIAKPAKPQQPKFKDLSVNSGFYFLSDTNHTYLWTKTSTSQAKNTKNGVVQTIGAETPVQK